MKVEVVMAAAAYLREAQCNVLGDRGRVDVYTYREGIRIAPLGAHVAMELRHPTREIIRALNVTN